MKRPTIRDVADAAGVSIGTVSNVVNSAAQVRRETRQRVEDAIRTLGYRPNSIAQSLIARRVRSDTAPAAIDAPRLLTVGYISVDYTARVGTIPVRDDRMTASGIAKSLGGPAANVAVMAAELGAPFQVRSELFTTVGDDADSDWALGTLAKRGVETGAVKRQSGGRLSRCIVIVEPDGSRTIVNEPFDLESGDLLEFLTPADRGAKACVHLEGYQVAAFGEHADAISKLGYITSIHTTGLPSDFRTEAGLARLRREFGLVFLSRDVARAIFGAELGDEALAERVEAFCRASKSIAGPGLLVFAMGEAGALCFGEGGACFFQAAPAVDVVDTTGAGDALTGAFLAAWLNGAHPQVALAIGVRVASLSVTVEGAQDLRLSDNDLAEFRHAVPARRNALEAVS